MTAALTTPRLEAARRHTGRGYRCVPVPAGEKGPRIHQWQHLRLGPHDLDAAFAGAGNIGLLVGEPSGWLVDVDLDCEEAARLADEFLPPTPAVTGRTGNPRSHHWYIAAGAVTKKFEDPVIDEMVVEMRSTGVQTLVGPSVHPETGETYDLLDGEPAVVEADVLAAAVAALFERVLKERYPAGLPEEAERAAVGGSSACGRPAIAGPAPPDVVARAGAYLDRMPGAVSGQRGHSKTYAASVCLAHGFGLSEEQTFTLLKERFNSRCDPPWSDRELQHKARDAVTKPHSRAFGWLRDAGPDLGGVDLTEFLTNMQNKPPPAGEGPSAPKSATDDDLDGGPVRLGEHDPATGRLVLSPKRTMPTADAYVRQFHAHAEGRTVLMYADEIREWSDNRYAVAEDGRLRHRLQPWLHAALRYQRIGPALKLVPFESNPTTINAALESIKMRVHLPADIQSPCWLDGRTDRPPAHEVLPCRTVNLHVPTGKITPATPALFTMNALDFDCDPSALQPALWLKFLGELWGDDAESIQLVQEWFGYCLISDTSQQKMLFIVGPTRSGKGTIGRVLRALIGDTNAVAPTTGSLATNFGLQPLIGKSLAVVSDARFAGEGLTAVTERLLCISGEDAVTIDRKFLPAITLRLPTRFVFLSNELPKLKDASGALVGRFLLPRPLVRSYYENEDTTLTSKLLEERAGILNWALAGWTSLKARGHFVQPRASQSAVELLQNLASPIKAFVRACCVVGVGRRVTVADLFGRWQSWCATEGQDHVGDKQTFGRDLAAAFPHLECRRRSDDGRFYDGIGLK